MTHGVNHRRSARADGAQAAPEEATATAAATPEPMQLPDDFVPTPQDVAHGQGSFGIGDRGSFVMGVQDALVQAGYMSQREREKQLVQFTETTAAAVERLQEKHGLEKTGRIDQQVIEVLRRESGLGRIWADEMGLPVVEGADGVAVTADKVFKGIGALGLGYQSTFMIGIHDALVESGHLSQRDRDYQHVLYTEVTAEAVRKLQQKHGLDVTGEIDKATLDQLIAESSLYDVWKPELTGQVNVGQAQGQTGMGARNMDGTTAVGVGAPGTMTQPMMSMMNGISPHVPEAPAGQPAPAETPAPVDWNNLGAQPAT